MKREGFGDRDRLVKSWLIPCLRPALDCDGDTPGLFFGSQLVRLAMSYTTVIIRWLQSPWAATLAIS
jgi:hypothetical protein